MFGCDRAREALVGDAYEALVGVVGSGCDGGLASEAFAGTDRKGETLRLFAGDSIIF